MKTHLRVFVFFMCAPFLAQALIVTNTSPLNAANDVAVSANLVVQFSTNVNTETVTSNRFFAHSARRGSRYGAISFNAATNEATLDFDADFGPGEQVFAYVSHGITNAAGTTSVTPHAWTFHTAAGGTAQFAESGQTFTAKVTSVTLGDVNGNGHLDTVFGVAQPGTNYMWVMTNDGHGVFTMSQSVGSLYIVKSAMADVDRDGDLDMFLAHFFAPASLWLNDGSGTFTRSDRVLPAASVIAPGDFNGDGFCDLALADAFNAAQVVVCLNDTQGVFTNVRSYAASAYAVDVGDMNGDGYLDIVSGAPANNTVLLNDGTGTFSTGWSGSDAFHDAMAIALGDVNGDGHLDQVASGWFGTGSGYGFRVMTNNGSGMLAVSQLAADYSVHGSSWGVTLGDLNGDGSLDVVLAGGIDGSINATIWTNDGTGLFGATGQQFGPHGYEWAVSIALGDVDGDGALDIAISDEESTPRPFWINNAPEMQVLGTNGAAIGDPTLLVFEPPDAAKGTRIGEFLTGPAAFTNRLTITNSGPGTLRLRQQPVVDRPDAGWFRAGSLPSSLPPGGTASLDIIFVPGLTGWGVLTARVSIANMGWHPATHGYETNMEIWISAAAVPPLAGNIYPDAPAFDIAHGADVSVLFGEDPMEATIGSDVLCVYGSQGGVWRGTVSYDADGRVASLYPSSDYRPGEFMTAGLLTTVSNAAGTRRFRPFAWSFYARATDGTGYFMQAPDPVIPRDNAYGTALADLNGDGILDAVVYVLQQGNGQRLSLAINDGTGRLVEHSELRGPGDYTSIRAPRTLSDLDGDGDIDIVALIGSPSTNGLAVWKNDGTGIFSNSFLDVWGSAAAGQLKTADVNGDGFMDVVLAAYAVQTNLPPIWLNDGTGRFSPVTNNSSGPMIFPATYWGCEIGDVNGDGAVDLVFGSSPDPTPNHLSVWFNDGRGRFMDSGQQLDTNTSWSVHLGDLNGNGLLDILAVRVRDVRVWTNDGAGFFSLATETALSPNIGQYHGQGLADLDGDGDLDTIVGGWELDANRVLLNDGTGQFTISDAEIGNGGWLYSNMGDLNGDGAVDLLMSRVNVIPDLQVWLNKTRPKAGFGKALRFDGVDDYLLMPGVPANQFSGSNDFTIAMWVRPETNGTLYRMFSYSAAEQLRDALTVESTGCVSLALAKGSFSGNSRAVSATAIPWNRWSHVAGVKDGAALRVYVNGVLTGTGVVHTTVMNAPASTSDTYIAASALPVSGYLRGDLDEIQIWNTALSAAQIADWMYRAPDRSHPRITNLVAHFDCNEGTALRTTSREGPPIQGDFSGGMDETAWMDSDVRDWRTWVNNPLEGSLVGSHADGTGNLAFEIVQQSAFGTVEVTAANAFQFTPPTNAFGTNLFTFQVITTNGMTSSVATAYVIVPHDYDEDEMLDIWEIHYSLDPSDPSDRSDDPDDDFFLNYQEHIADTDPRNSNSYFRLTGIEPTNSFAVEFICTNSRAYSLQFSTNLIDGAWLDMDGQTKIVGEAGGLMSLTDTNDAVHRAYRVGVSLP